MEDEDKGSSYKGYKPLNQPSRGRTPRQQSSQWHDAEQRTNQRTARFQDTGKGSSDINPRTGKPFGGVQRFGDKFSFTSKEDTATSPNSLKLKSNQQLLYNHITTEGGGDDYILLCYRKLREGIIASLEENIDPLILFPITVYEDSVDFCIAAVKRKNDHLYRSELFKSLSQLVLVLYPLFEDANIKRKNEMRKYYYMMLICSDNDTDRYELALKLKDLSSSPDIHFAWKIFNCLRVNVDFYNFSKLYENCDENEKFFLANVITKYREKTVRVLQKAFYRLPMEYFMKYLLFEERQQVESFIGNHAKISLMDDSVKLR